MSEHDEVLGALRDITAVLERIEAKIGQGPAVQAVGLRQVLSLTETAKAIRKGYEAARELVESGRIPARCENGRWYVPLASVQAYLSEKEAA